MGKRIFRNHSLLFLSLYTFCLGGIVGVLVDLDHWFNLTSFKGWGLAGRPLHVPMAVLIGCLGIYSYSRLRGWITKLVLKRILIISAVVVVLVGLEILWAMFMYDV